MARPLPEVEFDQAKAERVLERVKEIAPDKDTRLRLSPDIYWMRVPDYWWMVPRVTTCDESLPPNTVVVDDFRD